MFAFPNSWRLEPKAAIAGGETVVLIHGMGRSRLSMLPLGCALRRDGYRIVLYGYTSTRHGLVDHSAKFADFLAAQVFPDAAPGSVHLVGHSLGNLVIRQALGENPPAAVGRIVMLAPPNQGSRLAERLSPWWIFRWLLRPLPDLSAAPDAVVHRVPVPRAEIGIITGRDDRKVEVDLAHLPGNAETACLVVPAWHTFLMNRRDVQRAVGCFLKEGRFQ